MVAVAAGEYEIGAPARGFAYDNERRRHAVELAAFEIDRTPVTNAAYAEFMEETGAEPPMYWERDGDGGWVSTAMGRRDAGRPRPPRHPRLLGRGRRLRPLGRQAAADRARVGGGARRGSTASARPGNGPPRDFLAYPGFEAFPYREYSEVFFGDELQGAARRLLGDPPDVSGPASATGTCPQRRQIFAGLRCARDAMIAIDVHLDADAAATMARDVRAGLCAYPKELAPKYFYDERGSQLFEQITELPEYYPTRAEREILAERSAEILAAAGEPRHPGRARLRLGGEDPPPARARCATPAASRPTSRSTSPRRSPTRPPSRWSTSTRASRSAASSATSSSTWSGSPTATAARLIAFLGGTIGNLYPRPAPATSWRGSRRCSAPATSSCSAPTWSRSAARLEAAYDDAAGVTAEFNKNVLAVLNRELGADFDLDAFEHVARYDAEEERMDIRLRSLADQDGRGSTASTSTIDFAAGEEMRTEISTKFTRERLEAVYAGRRPGDARLVHRRRPATTRSASPGSPS